MPHGIGIRDPDAAVRIDLDLSRFGYAMREADELFHLPNCPSLKTGAKPVYSLMPWAPGDEGERTACPKCHPDKRRHEDVA
jgi:hypothetical protein